MSRTFEPVQAQVLQLPLISQLKDKHMFAPANAAHFTLQIPSVCNDFKVLAFDGAETISCFNIGESA